MLAFDSENEEAYRSSDRHIQFRHKTACCEVISGDRPVVFNGSPQRFRFSWIKSIMEAHPSYFGWNVTDCQSVVERLDGAGQYS
jgi:hypothetical protein